MSVSRVPLAAAFLLLGGCPSAGDITGDLEPGPDAGASESEARAAFDRDVAPMLDGFCAACHATPGSLGFMAPAPDVYDAVRAWPELIDLQQPTRSALVAKGAHDGPAWTVDQLPTLLDWIALEADEAGIAPEDEPETSAFAPIVGINTVDLTELGLPGTSITFRLEKLQVGFYISELMLTAGADGAHVAHPLFVTWTEGEPAPDPVDRFSGIELSVEPTQSQMIGGGTLVLVDIAPDALLSIHFAVAEPSYEPGGDDGGDDDGGGLGGGCQDVASFTANARPTLSANCAGCHAGGNAAATGATDMTRIDDLTPEGQAAACAQILSRVNLADTANSGIFLAPDPNSGAGHPFKFGGDVGAFDAFRNALLVWIAAEQ